MFGELENWHAHTVCSRLAKPFPQLPCSSFLLLVLVVCFALVAFVIVCIWGTCPCLQIDDLIRKA
jgi:hypothetical protein